MPTMCCLNCGGRREIVAYLARLPLHCTGCGRGLVPESDAVLPLLESLANPPANGNHAPEATPSLAYLGASNAELTEPSPAVPDEAAVPESPDFAPSQTEILIAPDPVLAPLVVSETISASSFQLPASGSAPSGSEESNKSKLADRLKEIASISAPVVAVPVPIEPTPEPELASPGQRGAARVLLYGLGLLAYFGGIGWLNILARAGVPSSLNAVLYFVPFALFVSIDLLLLVSRGQDVGKWCLGLRILKHDGTPTARDAFWLREFPFLVLPFVTVLADQTLGLAALLVPVVDALFIFTPSGRCLHDRLAKTVVVEK